MKYDGIRKVKRNRRLLKYLAEHQGESLTEVGKMFGITKQRVFTICKQYKEIRNDHKGSLR